MVPRFVDRLRHVHRRRRVLMERPCEFADFDEWKETCVPSYRHGTLLAAYVSWWRLFLAVDLAGEIQMGTRVLDFGASIGELARILPGDRIH